MKKLGAATILATMLTGLLAWGGTTIFDHESRISKNETLNGRIMIMQKQIKEIHKAVHGY